MKSESSTFTNEVERLLEIVNKCFPISKSFVLGDLNQDRPCCKCKHPMSQVHEREANTMYYLCFCCRHKEFSEQAKKTRDDQLKPVKGEQFMGFQRFSLVVNCYIGIIEGACEMH